MDFQNLNLEESLRILLSQFILPGESQQIERILQCFSTKYLKDNPNVFKNSDIPFTVAYSIVMLNTDLHSKNHKNKMKKQDYVNMVVGAKLGVPAEYLEKIYDSIANSEISTKIDCINSYY